MKEEKLLTPDPGVGPQDSRHNESTQLKFNLRTTPAQRLFGGQEAKTNTDPSQAEVKADSSNKTVSYATIARATQRSHPLV